MSSELNTDGILKIVEQNCELYKRKCIECEELRKELALFKGESSEKNDDKKIDDKPQKLKPIIKSTFNSDKCYCRVWNTGLGTQCTRDKKDGDYCKGHASKFKDGTLEFGSVDGIRPDKYSKYTKGKKEGGLIKWKHKEVKEEPVLTEEQKEEVLKLQEDIDEEHNELNEINELNDNENIEKDDELDLDIDDECLIEGVEYTQFNAGDGIIYLLNSDSRKVAQWNGYNENSIEWSTSIDEINHNTMKTK